MTDTIKPTTEIVRAEASRAIEIRHGIPTKAALLDSLEYAKTLIESGFMPAHIKQPHQAVIIMQRGRELGISPMQALGQLYVVHNKVSCETQLMLALCWRSGVLQEVHVVESSDAICRVEITRKGGTPHEYTFTYADAAKLGIASKDQWRKQTSVMLIWRAISKGLRIECPDALAGLYTFEELGIPTTVDNSGSIPHLVIDSKKFKPDLKAAKAEFKVLETTVENMNEEEPNVKTP